VLDLEEEVGNPDEIDLEMDDSEDGEPKAAEAKTTDPVTVDNEVLAEAGAEPIESVDEVAAIPDPEVAKEKVHEFAGTAVEEVEQAKEAILAEEETCDGKGLETRFLALDKCGFGRDFIQVSTCCLVLRLWLTGHCQFMDIPTGGPSTGPPRLQFDPEWLAISRAMHPFLPLSSSAPLPTPPQIESALREARTWIKENIIDTPYDVQTLENGVTLQPLDIEQVQTFCFTAAPHDAPAEAQQPNQWYTNMQTEAFAAFIGVENKVNPLPPGTADEAL
jgi:lariat debranching enzyme